MTVEMNQYQNISGVKKMGHRLGHEYQVTSLVLPRLKKYGFTHCLRCKAEITIGDWVRRTFGNIYHSRCFKRI
ncbi:MAG: hypothetical protein GTN97_07140 [Nitrosopumilaceae archaeon]|nr:hypothetical protein [Nitrosopumilaceae archaeon]